MEKYIIAIILVLATAFATYKNVQLIRRMKHLKRYATIASGVYENKQQSLEDIDQYIESQQIPEYKQKAIVFRLAITSDDYKKEELIDQLQLKELAFEKNKVNEKKVNFNADSFYWYLVAIIESKDNPQILVKLKEKMQEADYLDGYLYHVLATQLCLAFETQNKQYLSIYHETVQGNIQHYRYSKQMYILFKKIALLVLVHFNEAITEEDKRQLEDFTNSRIGKYLAEKLAFDYKNVEVKFEEKNIPIEQVKEIEYFQIQQNQDYTQAIYIQDIDISKQYQDFLIQEPQFNPVLESIYLEGQWIVQSKNELAIQSFVEQFQDYLNKK